MSFKILLISCKNMSTSWTRPCNVSMNCGFIDTFLIWPHGIQGIFDCKEFYLFFNSLANPAAPLGRDLCFAPTSSGECARCSVQYHAHNLWSNHKFSCRVLLKTFAGHRAHAIMRFVYRIEIVDALKPKYNDISSCKSHCKN